MPFFCEYCQFSAPNKYRYERHLATKKHARNYTLDNSTDNSTDNYSLDRTLDNSLDNATDNSDNTTDNYSLDRTLDNYTENYHSLDNDFDQLEYSSLFYNSIIYSFFYSFAQKFLNHKLFISFYKLFYN